ncbi:flagellar hook-basal body complex protein FliE [Pseudokineococcus marinus]|uniref:Flagellar hook-basal body complex protein FliE n=2 Tax=Kineosporiaceae TaxID=83778 RepID=A0A849BUH1_9ACTN|nr:flagellar hook-basal body complex protein FliE [Pseudokineococcus marinus]NNH24054.1 flagellar hook-basal body complex protein FliE [Pseudokineococcus marinus]
MGVEAIGSVGVRGVAPSLPSLPTGSVAPAGLVEQPSSSADVTRAFGAAMAQGLQTVQSMEATADVKAVQAATGDLTDVHDYVIAANQAKLATELTVAVRNKAVEAFSEIMRLQA